MKCKKTIISVIVLSSLGLNSSIDNAITVKEVKPVIESARTATPKKKVVKSQPITSDEILYKEELKDIKKKLLKLGHVVQQSSLIS